MDGVAVLVRLVRVHTALTGNGRFANREVTVVTPETRQSECGAANNEDECERFNETKNLMA